MNAFPGGYKNKGAGVQRRAVRVKSVRRSTALEAPRAGGAGPRDVSRRVRLSAFANRDTHANTGQLSIADRSASGQVTGVVIAVTGPQGGGCANPAASISWRIRGALRRPPIPPVTIYDASGTAIATMDPLTKVRTPLDRGGAPA